MTKEERILDIQSIHKAYKYASPYKRIGKIISSKGSLYEVGLSKAVLGSSVEFQTESQETCVGEVVSIEDGRCYVMPYKEISGINSETRVTLKGLTTTIRVGNGLLGRIVDYKCSPIDGKSSIDFTNSQKRSIFGKTINPLDRPQIHEILDIGVNSINSFMTMGKGQRMAVMAGSGVGKSVTLGMIARNTKTDINVIALVGERGREVREFIENDLKSGTLERSVVVVATSDTSPLIRMKSAYVAITIAEYFRDEGKDVLFMMDSITRFAMAHREVSLGLGEHPGQKGYTPSLFSKLPQLLERAGKIERGSITGIYAVLVEGNDMDEPITDAIKAISDGHIILSRELAVKSHFPAVDILQSISRVMNRVVSEEHWIVASHLRELLFTYRENEDLINIGAYVKGTNKKIDKAIVIYDDIMNLTKQIHGIDKPFNIDEIFDHLVEIARRAEKNVNPEAFKED